MHHHMTYLHLSNWAHSSRNSSSRVSSLGRLKLSRLANSSIGGTDGIVNLLEGMPFYDLQLKVYFGWNVPIGTVYRGLSY